MNHTAVTIAQTVRLTGAQALVRVLKASGITHFYGVCGGNLTGVLGAIQETPGLHYIGARHEASGAFMAAANFVATGQPAVCFAELGPGTTNLVGGLGMALNNRLALLAISTSLPTRREWPRTGVLMELDAPALVAPVTKWNTHVIAVERLPGILRQALRQALTGACGPVHLNIPGDVLQAPADFSVNDLDAPLSLYLPSGRAEANPVATSQAAQALIQARRPLLLAGGGVVQSEATDVFRELARRLGAPATCTQMALGVVDSDHPNFIGHGGALADVPTAQALREADVVLAVGCRFSSWLTERGMPWAPGWPQQKVIHIDIDPTVPGQALPADWALIGDARAVLGQLLTQLPADAASARDADWLPTLVQAHRRRHEELLALARDTGTLPHPAAVSLAIAQALPPDSLVVYDGGHTTFWSNTLTPAHAPRTRFNDSGMAQLGFGTPFALALQACAPSRPVFNIVGDGSFGFTLAELDTARRYGLPVVHLIHNNAAWGVIRRSQQRAGFELGVELSGTDYAAIARGFGCYGERVNRAADIGPAMARALASGQPAVIDIQTRFEPHPCTPAFGATLG